MVGYLKGKVISKNPDTLQCVLLAHHVGYELSVPKNLFESLIPGERVALWVHTHVREEALVLFGFASESEKQFFRVLLGVSGLGPKTALSLLSEHGAQRLTKYILAKDVDEISEAPGVGKKLAQRLVLELSGKLEKLAFINELEAHAAKTAGAAKAVPISPERQFREDLSSALQHLGYQPSQVKNTVEKIFAREGIDSMGFEACLKLALKELSSGRGISVTKEMPHV